MILWIYQAFINYNFIVHKILSTQHCFRHISAHVGNCVCKEKMCMLLITTWYNGRKCTKLVSKFLVAKNGLSFSVLCTAPFLKIILFQFTWWLPSILVHYVIYLQAVLPFLINWNEKQCRESNILTMEHKPVLENSSSAAVNTLLNAIIYLKVIKYLNIRMRQIY